MRPQPDFLHEFVQGDSNRTLLLLHGTGGNERDLIPLGRELDPNASLLSPRGKILEHGMPRFFRRLAEGVFDLEDLKTRTNELADFVAAAVRHYRLAADHVVGVGYSNGANIAASMLLLRPEIMRAAILFRAMVPLIPDKLPDLSSVRVCLGAGDQDPIVSGSDTRRLAELLRSAGADVTIRFTHAGHGLINLDVETAQQWLQAISHRFAPMKTTRLEAFSDGVLAIIITIMVLELKVPHTVELAALKPLLPVLLSYVLSFIYIGIYWNNHHHLFQATEQVSGGILWANLHLLFWLSLLPFTTGWIGQNGLAPIPTAVYGFVLLMAAVAYYILERTIIAKEGSRSIVASAIGSDWKGRFSAVLYLVAIPLAFVSAWIASALYVFAALLWLIPDPRIERKLEKRENAEERQKPQFESKAQGQPNESS